MLIKAAGMLLEQQRSSMSATTSPDAPAASSEFGLSPSGPAFRLGHESGDAAGDWRVEWKLGRNCSLAPRQLLGCYSVLCALSLAVADPRLRGSCPVGALHSERVHEIR